MFYITNNKVAIEIFTKNQSMDLSNITHDIIFKTLESIFDKDSTKLEIIFLQNYIKNNFASEHKSKRKTTARDIEDFLADLFHAKVADTQKKIDNKKENNNNLVENYIKRNKLEKNDLIFPNNYTLSVKTFIPSNNEINLGSFAREALFHGILANYGGERKMGLGSKIQLKSKFEEITKDGNWEKFTDRFKMMWEGIFTNDILFIIKGSNEIDFYFLASDDFNEYVVSKVIKSPSSAIEILNRYEGNSIRVERDAFLKLKKTKHIGIKFEDNFNNIFTKLESGYNALNNQLLTKGYVSSDISEILSLYKNALNKVFETSDTMERSNETFFHKKLLNGD